MRSLLLFFLFHLLIVQAEDHKSTIENAGGQHHGSFVCIILLPGACERILFNETTAISLYMICAPCYAGLTLLHSHLHLDRIDTGCGYANGSLMNMDCFAIVRKIRGV